MRVSRAIKSVLGAVASSVGPDGRNGQANGHKPYRYSAFDLLRHGFSQADWSRAWRKHHLKSSYDVVVVGGAYGLDTPGQGGPGVGGCWVRYPICGEMRTMPGLSASPPPRT